MPDLINSSLYPSLAPCPTNAVIVSRTSTAHPPLIYPLRARPGTWSAPIADEMKPAKSRSFQALKPLALAALTIAFGAQAQAAPRCRDFFEIRHILEAGRKAAIVSWDREIKQSLKSPIMHVSESGSAKLSQPFIISFNESHSSFTFRAPVETLAISDVPSLDFSVLVTRGLWKAKLLKGNTDTANFGSVEAADTVLRLSKIIEHQGEIRETLMRRYEAQGIEVREGVDDYRRADVVKSLQSTNFILTSAQEPIAQIQAQRRLPDTKLNLEEQFGIELPADGKTFELGRLLIESNSPQAKALAKSYTGDERGTSIVSLLLYQKLLGWLNWDVQASRTYMQVNESVRRVLQHRSSPLKFDGAQEVSGTSGVREWILTATRENLLKSEENVVRALLLARLKYWRSLNPDKDQRYVLFLRPNEWPVLERLGIIQFGKPISPDYISIDAPRSELIKPEESRALELFPESLTWLIEKLSKSPQS